MKCPICDKSDFKKVFNLFDDRYGEPNLYSIKECVKCGHFCTFPRIKNENLSDLYGNFYPRKNINIKSILDEAKKESKKYSSFFRWLKGTNNQGQFYARKNDLFLDIGCGSGVSLIEAKNLGAKAFGLEADPNVKRIANKLNLKIYNGDLENSPFKDTLFDLIVLNQVIEHIPEPDLLLKKLTNNLKRSGLMIISLPNVDSFWRFLFKDKWINWHVPYHLHHFKEKNFEYEGVLSELKDEKNILFTNNFWESIFFNKEIFTEINEDVIATTFDFKNEELILKSYLLNNKKNLDILTYDKLINEENNNENNPEVSIFSDVKNFDKYIKPLINDFEQSFFEDFNHNANQNILILNSKKDWLITFEKNTEDQFDLSALKKLKDFNKYTLKQNEDIYSIYSKDILEEKNDAIKQLTFENIYSIESGGLQFISNFLIDSKKLETISKKFFNLKSYKDKSTFLFAKVDIKDENSNKIKYLPDLEDLNFLIRNILKISNEEYLEIISQSIPEKNPILYTETSLKIP